MDLHDSDSLRGWIWQIDRRERNQANEGNQPNFEPRTVDLDEILDEIDRSETNQANFQQRVVDLDESECTMKGDAKKHAITVGIGGTVGETVSFTAEHLGKVELNGGGQSGTEQGVDYTFYRLPDGTFRVLVERGDTAMLIPSDMSEALSRGQRNNFSYGRMTLEEMKAHPFNFGPAYDALMENHPETVQNRV